MRMSAWDQRRFQADMSCDRATSNSRELWIDTAQLRLTAFGMAGITIDQLAGALRKTRGSFYHLFRDRDELLAALLQRWDQTCRFFPIQPAPTNEADALALMQSLSGHQADGERYDGRFDAAVREWARSDARARKAVEQADRERMVMLQELFVASGYSVHQAAIHAEILYRHQIGFHLSGAHRGKRDKRQALRECLEILAPIRRSSPMPPDGKELP